MSSPAVEQLNLSDGRTASDVWAVQQAAYSVEADLVGFDDIPPLHETVDELVARDLSWLGVRSRDGGVIAALGFARTAGHIDIDRLVVAPSHFRRGIASALLRTLEPGVRVTVSTGTANLPAHQFYESHGFHSIGEVVVAPGFSITHFVREGTP